MSYDSYLHEKIGETRDIIKRLDSKVSDRIETEDRARIRRYISFLKADRDAMFSFNWKKDGAQFLPQIIHDLCEVEAFLKICQHNIAWRPCIGFTDLVELFMSVCKDYLSIADSHEKYYDCGKYHGYNMVANFIKEWEES